MAIEPITAHKLIGVEWQLFCWGCVGGFIAQIVLLIPVYREKPEIIPEWIKNKDARLFNVFMIALWTVIGGVLVSAYAQSGQQFSAILAINIGASAPALIAGFAKKSPPIEPGDNIKD